MLGYPLRMEKVRNEKRQKRIGVDLFAVILHQPIGPVYGPPPSSSAVSATMRTPQKGTKRERSSAALPPPFGKSEKREEAKTAPDGVAGNLAKTDQNVASEATNA